MAELDFAVVGSGFGGSVAALRLAEKGYTVRVFEKGRRWTPETLPHSNTEVTRSTWMPGVGLRGTLSVTMLGRLMVFSGVGVGGGSLVYGGVLDTPDDAFFTDPRWAGLDPDWRSTLAPFYATARRMLGAARPSRTTAVEEALRTVLTEQGVGGAFRQCPTGVYFGSPGASAPDPYFDGAGPPRTGCTFCGACTIGCRVGAKNTLDRNYLHLAEQAGARIAPHTRVELIRPRGAADGRGGYALEIVGPDGPRTVDAGAVVLAGGVLGTVGLLARCREARALPGLSPRLGEAVDTNTEVMRTVTGRADVSGGLASAARGRLPDGTDILIGRLGPRSDALAPLASVPVPPGRGPRALRFAATVARHPLRWLRSLPRPGWSRRTYLVVGFATGRATVRLALRRGIFGSRLSALDLDMVGDDGQTTTAAVAARMAELTDGEVGALWPETLLGLHPTSHPLGGCAMGADARSGVIDAQHRVFGYRGLYVVDGSAITGRLGTNPALTITALAERAMHFIPPCAAG